jgi:hypothetical protein
MSDDGEGFGDGTGFGTGTGSGYGETVSEQMGDYE